MHQRGLGPDPGKEPERYDSIDINTNTNTSSGAAARGAQSKSGVGEDIMDEEADAGTLPQESDDAENNQKEDMASRGATRMIRELSDTGAAFSPDLIYIFSLYAFF
jgi:hypothetical protein